MTTTAPTTTRVTSEQVKEELAKHTTHQELVHWILKKVELCEPDHFHVCDGSETEYNTLCEQMVASGMFIRLKRKNCFLARSTEDDVARLESRTFVCSKTKEQAGPTNNHADPVVMTAKMHNLFKGCMHGRTMFAIPFSMGPLKSPLSQIGIQLTDSPYVVVSMKIMTRMGQGVLDILGPTGKYVHCLHSVGAPLKSGDKDSTWPSNPDKYIVHFPESRKILSYGSGYGGNALLGKKAFALRIASVMARDEGWLSEHMLILGITNPQGKKKYIAAAFPSAGGKTNLAMVMPPPEFSKLGWKIETIGDDIAWIRYGQDGRLWAINPESGFFGVAPGTSMHSNPNAMKAIEQNTIFTNVALTEDNDVWWEGLTKTPPPNLIDWHGKPYVSGKGLAAHPNSRFTAPINQCPIIDPKYDDPKGVPIDAILFGGRRSKTIPLVNEALSWNHGVFLGASMSSEATSAALDVKSEIRHDPFAMLPFCGYNMADYFGHWCDMGGKLCPDKSKLPKLYFVNWFRKDNQGHFLWPGFSQNVRVLKWIFERTDGVEDIACKTPIGILPKDEGGLDLNNLDVPKQIMHELNNVNVAEWRDEVKNIRVYFDKTFGKTIPAELMQELDALEERLK